MSITSRKPQKQPHCYVLDFTEFLFLTEEYYNCPNTHASFNLIDTYTITPKRYLHGTRFDRSVHHI